MILCQYLIEMRRRKITIFNLCNRDAFIIINSILYGVLYTSKVILLEIWKNMKNIKMSITFLQFIYIS